MSTAASLHQSRKRKNGVMMMLCVVAAGIGLAWLALILGALLYKGLAGVSLSVFTEMTPPPGDAGGLLNAIYGSIVMTIIGIIVGTPIGVLAGTYMAEYGRFSSSPRWCASSTTSCCRRRRSSSVCSSMS